MINLEQKGKIIGALIKAGVTQADIAKRANVAQPTVSYVISGKSRSHKIERIITELTGFKFPANQRVIRERAAQI